eukprot:977292-Alexandrium_andersonii.AAC.1
MHLLLYTISTGRRATPVLPAIRRRLRARRTPAWIASLTKEVGFCQTDPRQVATNDALPLATGLDCGLGLPGSP